MEERRGRALFWAARLAILAAAAGYALAVITSGGGDDTVSIYGYELLTLLPEYAREYGEANHWLGVGLMVCWGAVVVAALALLLAGILSVGRSKRRCSAVSGLCLLSVAINLFVFSVFSVISEVESLMDRLVESFVDLGDIKFLNLGAGYYLILIATALAAVLARAARARYDWQGLTSSGVRLRLMGSVLTNIAVIGCFCPMVGIGAGDGQLTLFGGTLAGVGAGLAAWSEKVVGGVLFWYVIAIVGAVLASALARVPGRAGSAVPGAFSVLGATGLALMVRALGAGSVELAYDLVDVSYRWGWWLAFCALTAAATLNFAAVVIDSPFATTAKIETERPEAKVATETTPEA